MLTSEGQTCPLGTAFTRPDSLRAVFYLLKVEDAEKRAPIIAFLLQGKLTADEVDQYVKTLEQQVTEATPAPLSEEVSSRATPLEDRPASTDLSEQHTDGPFTMQKAEATDTPHHVVQEKTPAPAGQSTSELVVFEKHTIVGVSKLKTVLKAMKTYSDARSEQPSLSTEEALLLDQIIEVAQQIRQAPVEQPEN